MLITTQSEFEEKFKVIIANGNDIENKLIELVSLYDFSENEPLLVEGIFFLKYCIDFEYIRLIHAALSRKNSSSFQDWALSKPEAIAIIDLIVHKIKISEPCIYPPYRYYLTEDLLVLFRDVMRSCVLNGIKLEPDDNVMKIFLCMRFGFNMEKRGGIFKSAIKIGYLNLNLFSDNEIYYLLGFSLDHPRVALRNLTECYGELHAAQTQWLNNEGLNNDQVYHIFKWSCYAGHLPMAEKMLDMKNYQDNKRTLNIADANDNRMYWNSSINVFIAFEKCQRLDVKVNLVKLILRYYYDDERVEKTMAFKLAQESQSNIYTLVYPDLLKCTHLSRNYSPDGWEMENDRQVKSPVTLQRHYLSLLTPDEVDLAVLEDVLLPQSLPEIELYEQANNFNSLEEFQRFCINLAVTDAIILEKINMLEIIIRIAEKRNCQIYWIEAYECCLQNDFYSGIESLIELQPNSLSEILERKEAYAYKTQKTTLKYFIPKGPNKTQTKEDIMKVLNKLHSIPAIMFLLNFIEQQDYDYVRSCDNKTFFKDSKGIKTSKTYFDIESAFKRKINLIECEIHARNNGQIVRDPDVAKFMASHRSKFNIPFLKSKSDQRLNDINKGKEEEIKHSIYLLDKTSP